ncbi:MAG TPA: alpha/beta hydrolase [Clostridiaceae bacterium]|nr:alpha/beta hydrolase [Clostridiaceae bacterium]
MIDILVHGLGQNETSWNEVKNQLNNNGINVETPNLFSIVKNYQVNYENMYKTFADYCNSFKEKLNLCGLSLGGILSIDYAIEYPEKVNSIILIGTTYEIPKRMFKLQNFIFKFMPKSTFENMGIKKNDFINLTNSMEDLDIKSKVDNIKCPALILCGEKDNVNMESAKQLNRNIKESKLEIIKNAGHEVNTESPKELASVMSEYWK